MLCYSLVSPITELLPNMYMSWWYPTNNNIEKYNKMYMFRFVAVCLVWIPILLQIYKNTKNKNFIIIVSILIFSAFYLRHKLSYDNPYPGYLYMIALILLFYELTSKNKWYILGLIFLGAYLIGKYRNKNIHYDYAGRLIFSSGFIHFLNILKKIDKYIANDG